MNHDQLIQSALNEVENATTTTEIENVRIKYFGKNGFFTKELKSLSNLSIEDRKEIGIKLNSFKNDFFSRIQTQKDLIESHEVNSKLKNDSLDSSLPGREDHSINAKIHPINHTINEITTILGGMGLIYEEGPDIEDDFHNFSALNIPKNHPARQMHDTFYVKNKKEETYVLRTHTSPVQIRTLKKKNYHLKFLLRGGLIVAIQTLLIPLCFIKLKG